MEKELYVISFKSTHYAIMAENQLIDFDIQVMPTPREITANCGLSIGFHPRDYEDIIQIIKSWDDHENIIELYSLNPKTRGIRKIQY